MQFYVYQTTNLINGKKYIGKHTGKLNDEYLGSGSLLKKAIKKYGKENFFREILAITNDAESLDLLEKYYIKKFEANTNPDFYNLTEGGTGGNTLKGLTPDQINKRTLKIKEAIQIKPQEEKEKISAHKSKAMKQLRSDPRLEAKRIAKFKETYWSKSPESLKELYKTRSGGNNYCAKKVKTPIGKFECAKDAAIAYNVNTQTVLNRCRNKNFPDWNIINE